MDSSDSDKRPPALPEGGPSSDSSASPSLSGVPSPRRKRLSKVWEQIEAEPLNSGSPPPAPLEAPSPPKGKALSSRWRQKLVTDVPPAEAVGTPPIDAPSVPPGVPEPPPPARARSLSSRWRQKMVEAQATPEGESVPEAPPKARSVGSRWRQKMVEAPAEEAAAPQGPTAEAKPGPPQGGTGFRRRWVENLKYVKEGVQAEEPAPKEEKPFRSRWRENLRYNRPQETQPQSEPDVPRSQAPAEGPPKKFQSRWRDNLKFNRPQEASALPPAPEMPPEREFQASPPAPPPPAKSEPEAKKPFRPRWQENLRYNKALPMDPRMLPGDLPLPVPSAQHPREELPPDRGLVLGGAPGGLGLPVEEAPLAVGLGVPVEEVPLAAGPEVPPALDLAVPVEEAPLAVGLAVPVEEAALALGLAVPVEEAPLALGLAVPVEEAPLALGLAVPVEEAPPETPVPPVAVTETPAQAPVIRGARGKLLPRPKALEAPPPPSEPDELRPMGAASEGVAVGGDLALGAPEAEPEDQLFPAGGLDATVLEQLKAAPPPSLPPEYKPTPPPLPPEVKPAPPAVREVVLPPEIEEPRKARPPVAAPQPKKISAAEPALEGGPTGTEPVPTQKAGKYVPTARATTSAGRGANIQVVGEERQRPTVKKQIPPNARVSVTQLAVFTRQFAVMVKAGVTVHRALTFFAEGGQEGILPQVVDDVATRVSSGSRLSQALRAYPNVFSDVYLGLVETAESSSQMDTIFEKLADLLERQDDLRKRVMATITYPLFLCATSLVAVALFVYFILPMMAPLFQGLHMELPLPTRILLNMRWVIPLFGGAAIASIAGYYVGRTAIAAYLRRSVRTQRMVDGAILSLPLVGKVAEKLVISRILYSLATMIDAGVNVSEALKRCVSVAGNRILSDRLDAARIDLMDGKTLHEALEGHNVFPRGCVQMLSVGEESSNLEVTLRYAAEFYEEEVEVTMTRFASMLEPMVMCVMGIFVGFIVLSAILPTVKMLENL